MKKGFLIFFICSLIGTAPCWGEDQAAHDASACAVDNIINYYSSMAKLGDVNQPGTNLYKDKLAYFKENRELMVSRIVETGAYDHLGRIYHVCENMYNGNTRYLGYTPAKNKVNEDAYFDALTGHKYIKNGSDTYAEYSKKGKFLKIVFSDLPLLNNSRSVHPITKNCYILYKKCSDGKENAISLSWDKAHPEGWKADKLLVSIN